MALIEESVLFHYGFLVAIVSALNDNNLLLFAFLDSL